jgi:hypothetical protein
MLTIVCTAVPCIPVHVNTKHKFHIYTYYTVVVVVVVGIRPTMQ